VIVSKPGVMPFTLPERSIVAIEEFELIHIPPVVSLVNVSPDPVQMAGIPLIAAGRAFTKTAFIAKQPSASV